MFRPVLIAAACGLLLAAAQPASADPLVAAAAPAQSEAGTTTSLETAAARAGATARTVAMSLIGLAFAVAGAALAFRRDFKDAAGVFVVGVVAVLFASPAGVSLIRATVSSIFG